MKLHRTRDEWAKIKPDGRWYYQREKMALEDLATLFAEVERLREALEICADDHAEGGAHKVARQALGEGE